MDANLKFGKSAAISDRCEDRMNSLLLPATKKAAPGYDRPNLEAGSFKPWPMSNPPRTPRELQIVSIPIFHLKRLSLEAASRSTTTFVSAKARSESSSMPALLLSHSSASCRKAKGREGRRGKERKGKETKTKEKVRKDKVRKSDDTSRRNVGRSFTTSVAHLLARESSGPLFAIQDAAAGAGRPQDWHLMQSRHERVHFRPHARGPSGLLIAHWSYIQNSKRVHLLGKEDGHRCGHLAPHAVADDARRRNVLMLHEAHDIGGHVQVAHLRHVRALAVVPHVQ
mmetsp:Transcript_784/g.3229  ORF Transcript_784/g.3229 Transcript_784/m.3229 type:complete len:283 (-) Transcript_784:500-1348(-)